MLMKAVQEALMEAVWKARELGFHNIIILNGKRRLEQVYNAKRKPNWQEKKTMIVDVHNLTQHGMNFITIFVPKVHKLASIATKRPFHCYWVHPALL